MPTYLYRCATHGVFELVEKISEAGGPRPCPSCGVMSRRVYTPVIDVWHTDGAFKTDHVNDTLPGDKRERLNKQWSAAWGEPPPPPAPDVPKNSGEKW